MHCHTVKVEVLFAMCKCEGRLRVTSARADSAECLDESHGARGREAGCFSAQ
jgi:hypothetical protein